MAAPAVGVVNARGSFKVDRAHVTNTATLFEGSTVATQQAAAEMRLSGGTRVLLAPGSRVTAMRNSVVLETGEAQIDGPGSSSVIARSLHVEREGPGSVARVAVDGDALRIAAPSGTLSVRNEGRTLVARLQNGETARLETPGRTPGTTVKISGRVTFRDGRYFLRDKVSGADFELRGADLAAWVGKDADIAGDLISSNVVRVQQTMRAAAAAAGTSKAVVAGIVIVGGAGAGLGLGLTRSEPEPTVSKP